MKTLRLLFASFIFCFLFMSQTNAQQINNATPCFFNVKANTIPVGTCAFTGVGPYFPALGTGVTPVGLPGPPGSHFVVGYGVDRPGIPVRIPGEPACGYGIGYFVGFCSGAPVFADYDPATTNLNIHF